MGLKHHTVIFVPHSRARFHKVRISNRQLKFLIGTLATLTVSAGYVTYSYFATSTNLDELNRLRRENDQLRTVNSAFEASVREMQGQLASFEDRTAELAIVAGLDGLPTSTERVGSGGTGAGGTAVATGPDLQQLARRSSALASQLTSVTDELDRRSHWLASVPTLAPVAGVYTSGYGRRRDPFTGRPDFHSGVDISAPRGRAVVAPADAVVTAAGVEGALGRAVFLSHGFGLATRFGHLAEIAVHPGQKVQRGDVIGYVGNSGRSTGFHLHYEVLQGNQQVDPIAYILDRASSAGGS